MIAFAIVFAVSAVVLFAVCMFSDDPKAVKMFGVLPGIALLSAAIACAWADGQRSGCIDTTNGRPPYVLTTQPDGSVEWAKKEIK
jgi:hypothetical protein